MPVRDKAVAGMIRHKHGSLAFKTLDDDQFAKVGELGWISRHQYEKIEQSYDDAYVALIDSIDWPRVLIEATQRHLALEHKDEDYTGMLCAECVNEALLADGTYNDWKGQPKAPREIS